MKIINPQRYQALVDQALSAPFTGWDFSWLDERMVQEEPPWDYTSVVKEHLVNARSLLDMGTGGGEFLASLAPLPPETHATESYPPNQRIAKTRLTPLGVYVHDIQDKSRLPFDNQYFDLILNRHDDFNPLEIYRTLKPGGRFITQQVGGLNNLEINQVLEDAISFPFTSWSLVSTETELSAAGLIVDRAESAALRTQFLDIGALVYYLKAIPWQVEGFNPVSHAEKLVHLHNYIERQGSFSTTAHRFLILAHKEANPL
jgi:SAM-dependent methyltransferase